MPQTLFTRSQNAFLTAKTLMPGGVNSPVRACKALGMSPLVVEKASGSFIFDLDEKGYIDYCMSWGAIILGHADPLINKALNDQMNKGSSYGALCEQEIKLAKTLVTHIPHLEKIRFVSSGTEATMSALRLARGYTGKSKIIKFAGNYHGHHDALLKESGSFLGEASLPCSLGVSQGFIQDTLVLPYNDPHAFEALAPLQNEIAACIFEPVCGNMGVVLPTFEFLQALCNFCKAYQILIIVDEVMTGFRTNFCGAAKDFSIEGDLYCYGKIIGGGLPSAFFGGKAHIMDHLAPEGGVFQAGTLSGNPLAMSAGLAVTSSMLEPDFYKRLQQKADRLLEPIEEAILSEDLNCTLNRYGSMFTVFFGLDSVTSYSDVKKQDQTRFNEFYKFLFEKGVYLSPSAYEANFMSMAHSDEDLDYTKDIIIEGLIRF